MSDSPTSVRYGFKALTVSPEGLLTSPSAILAETFPPLATVTAKCPHGGFHLAPGTNCSCGIYAYDQMSGIPYVSLAGPNSLVAVMEVRGPWLPVPGGARARQARIAGLVASLIGSVESARRDKMEEVYSCLPRVQSEADAALRYGLGSHLMSMAS